EILIVDEVLAVGDFAFQKKCLNRMSEVANGGRTVLFVSHNLATAEHLCNKVVLLEAGKTVYAGRPDEVTAVYLNSISDQSADTDVTLVDLTHAAGRPNNYRQMLTSLEMSGGDDMPIASGLRLGAPLKFYVSFDLEQPTPHLDVTLTFHNNLGQ